MTNDEALKKFEDLFSDCFGGYLFDCQENDRIEAIENVLSTFTLSINKLLFLVTLDPIKVKLIADQVHKNIDMLINQSLANKDLKPFGYIDEEYIKEYLHSNDLTIKGENI